MTREEEAFATKRAWKSVEEIQRAKELYLSGMSTLEVSFEVDKGQATVWNLMKFLGVNRSRRYSTPEERHLAKELRKAGASFNEIGSMLGFTGDAIRHWFTVDPYKEVAG